VFLESKLVDRPLLLADINDIRDTIVISVPEIKLLAQYKTAAMGALSGLELAEQ